MQAHLVTVAAGATLGSVLLALSVIDLRVRKLPDALTLPLIGAGLVWAIWEGRPWQTHAVGAALGYVIFVAIEVAYRHVRGQDGLGRGDAKLLAAGGAWCGLYGLPLIVLAASAAGLVWLLGGAAIRHQALDRHTSIPFGPFLAVAIFFVWITVTLGRTSAPFF